MEQDIVSHFQPLIVGVGGTVRADSSSEKALKVSLSVAEKLGAKTVLLGGKDIDLPTYNPEEQSRTPQAQRLVRLLRRANGIIIASPGYHGSISGMIKNALDYTEDMRDDELPYFEGRAVGCIATAYGWQATGSTLSTVRSIVHALRGWPTPLGAGINSAEPVFDGSGRCINERASIQLECVGRQVVEFAYAQLAYRQRHGIPEQWRAAA
ncbi:MAG: NAD(P)H-dependent oxidoreductase [Roseitalea sp.]|jgi:FMN reductase|nr:NAD(P)H-dependent oxidoreductase [Roseitalea sp.]MBO6722062.1 NAD(P)H-dependent oxidoreductase [Roseitalea sp.]MBO6741682.1 NAD(P)H-dependent oxidoreductase [Roseitalea sp.]